MGKTESPSWFPPDGFPSPAPFVRGVHNGRFNFLLKQIDNQLHRDRLIRRGIPL